MPRKYCLSCQYPIRTCICKHVRKIDCRTRFHLLQHPREEKAAKNTGKLVSLCLPKTKIWIGESEPDFWELKANIALQSDCTAVIYPSSTSMTLDGQNKTNLRVKGFTDIILIDATWRKAYKMWKLNPWLSDLTALRFESIVSTYKVRHTNIKDALSTLESVYQYLVMIEPDAKAESLIDLFEARQHHLSSKPPI